MHKKVSISLSRLRTLEKPVCVGVTWHHYVNSFVSVTYCDDIQNAEETMDTVSGIDLLHHIFFAILEDKMYILSQATQAQLNH